MQLQHRSCTREQECLATRLTVKVGTNVFVNAARGMQPTLVAEVQDDVRQTAFESAALSPIPKSSPKTVAELRPLTAVFLVDKDSRSELARVAADTNELAEAEADQ